MTLTGTIAYTIRARRRSQTLARLMRNPLAAPALVTMAAIVLLVALADILAPLDPDATDLVNSLAAPSWQHPMGTDGIGRDIWSRILHGGQITLLGALLVLTIAVVIGLTAGLTAGYYGKWLDAAASWGTSLTLALPVMIVLLAARAAFGPNLFAIMGIFGLLIAPSVYLLVRNSVRGVRNELYVDAARVSGLSDARILSRHILAAVRAPLIIQAMFVASVAIGVQAALDFLGLGTSTGPTWGGMLSEGFSQVYKAPQLLFWPALILGLMTASLLVLGNALRDTVEDRPRAARRHRKGSAQDSVRSSDGGVPASGPGSTPSSVPADVLLAVDGVSLTYNTPRDGIREIVHDVSLAVRRGKVLGLVGESGSGKTQLAFSILGLLPEPARITGGRVILDGTDLLTLSPMQRRRSRIGGVAYIPQEPMANLDPCFTIGDQLTEPLRVARGMSRAEAKRTAEDLLSAVSIVDPEATMRRYPHEISGGMAQRVLIAAALSLDPKLLIADEPTTALDVTVQSGVLALLRRLQRERGLAVLLVTHDLGVAAELCDDIAVLRNGRIVESGSVEDVFYRPSAEYTRDLLASIFADAPPRPDLIEPASGGNA